MTINVSHQIGFEFFFYDRILQQLLIIQLMELFGLIWFFNGMEFSNENIQKKLFLNISLYTRLTSISASAAESSNFNS